MPLNTRAFAIAAGTVASGAMFGLTLLLLVQPGPRPTLSLAGKLLFGYSVSVPGAFVGAMWAYAYGFALGAILAFVYNLMDAPPAPPVE
ncbi:MAG: hypothetical protein ACE5HQ_10070 [Gemmatimonadota bacterium]